MTFTITPDELSSLDASLERVVEPGLFDILAGTSSARLNSGVMEVVEK